MTGHSELFAYVGAWDKAKSVVENTFGIYRSNAATGALLPVGTAGPPVCVGAICVDGRRRVLYCVDEVPTHGEYAYGGGGQVFAFAIDATSGALTEINRSASFGSQPSYLVLDATGRYLLVAHHTSREPSTAVVSDGDGRFRIDLRYDDATVVLFPLDERGAIGEPCDVHTYTGDGGPLPFQTHPHLHSIARAPSGAFFVVCDKGCDRIYVLSVDASSGTLRPLDAKTVVAFPGSSPRYSVFHPTAPFLFVNYETRAVVSTFRYDESGHLEEVATVGALPPGVDDSPEMMQSDLRIHPSGRYLYDLVRGLHAVSVFGLDDGTGRLELLQTVTLGGRGPRACAITPDGRFLHVATTLSNTVEAWAIGDDGLLTASAPPVEQLRAGAIAHFAEGNNG